MNEMDTLRIYLAGPVESPIEEAVEKATRGEDNSSNMVHWRHLLSARVYNQIRQHVQEEHIEDMPEEESKVVEELLSNFIFLNPLRGHSSYILDVINGIRDIENMKDILPFTTPACISKRCIRDVMNSDIVVANLDQIEENRSVGTFMELGIAATDPKKIIIVIADKYNPILKHPMLSSIISLRVRSINEAAQAITCINGVECGYKYGD